MMRALAALFLARPAAIPLAIPLAILLGVVLLLAGCGAKPEPSWFPLNAGARWDYQVTTDTDGITRTDSQTISVTGVGQFKGQPAYTRRSEAGSNIGVEYLLLASPQAITRVAQRTDLQDAPVADEHPRTVLKLPLQVGGTWITPTVAYAVLRKAEFPRELKYSKPLQMVYTVEAMDETVEVPAGQFKHCARISGRADLTIYADPVGGFKKIPIVSTEWYCRDVGLVKLLRVESIETSFFTGGRVEMVLTGYRIR
jgi:hypothetical protein